MGISLQNKIIQETVFLLRRENGAVFLVSENTHYADCIMLAIIANY